jgi:hypothetical protein
LLFLAVRENIILKKKRGAGFERANKGEEKIGREEGTERGWEKKKEKIPSFTNFKIYESQHQSIPPTTNTSATYFICLIFFELLCAESQRK